ncbi:hypothetical protein EV126DRAFT_67968 [Verticillium dahliae]|nr:hypothetical protein EV126DRAFT_67968 [Verticillium dahliae]
MACAVWLRENDPRRISQRLEEARSPVPICPGIPTLRPTRRLLNPKQQLLLIRWTLFMPSDGDTAGLIFNHRRLEHRHTDGEPFFGPARPNQAAGSLDTTLKSCTPRTSRHSYHQKVVVFMYAAAAVLISCLSHVCGERHGLWRYLETIEHKEREHNKSSSAAIEHQTPAQNDQRILIRGFLSPHPR